MLLPSALRRVGGLTVGALWSSGTTYLLFTLYARSAEEGDLGRFVALSSLVLLATQLLDGGSGLLMVRDVASLNEEGERRTVIGQTFQRRMRGMALTLPIVVVSAAFAFAPGDYRAAAATGVFLVGSSVYGFVLQALQARSNFRRVVVLQAANGVVFILGAGAVTLAADQPSLTTMLLVPTFGFMSLAGVALWAIREELVGASRLYASNRKRELYAVRGAATAVAITSNADQILLGASSPQTLAVYAGAQRAALGLAALSNALMSYLLPTVAAGEAGTQHRLVRLSWRLALPVGLLAGAIGGMLSFPLTFVYGDEQLASPQVLALLMSAYALGALSSLSVSVLYALRRGASVAAITSAQAVLVLAGSAVGAATESAVATAVAVLTGRAIYLFGSAAVATRNLRNRP